MADDREPPALFDDDADTPESKPDEETNDNPFIGETTEITLDDGEPKEEEPPVEESAEGAADGVGDEQEQKTETSAAASVDVTNLSKPSADDSKPPSKEKAEVGI